MTHLQQETLHNSQIGNICEAPVVTFLQIPYLFQDLAIFQEFLITVFQNVVFHAKKECQQSSICKKKTVKCS